MMNQGNRVTMLGDGAWGTAVALLLASNGYEVVVWCHDPGQAKLLEETRYNERYLPGVELPDTIKVTADLAYAMRSSSWIFEALPVVHMRSVLHNAIPLVTSDQTWIILSKGLEQQRLLLPTQIMEDLFGNQLRTVVLSGPSFAHDLVGKQPTGVVLASSDAACATAVQRMLRNNYFYPEISSDTLGVQVGGAVKNLIALGIGLLDGAGYGDNTKALFFMRGLQEISLLAKAFGGMPDTIYGLSGVGDLVLTAMGKHSRNTLLGKRLGAGERLQAIVDALGTTPEGINTVQSIYQYGIHHNLDLPACAGVYHVLFDGMSVAQMVGELGR
jgi:glycerol-3-phosphate dehydrogenase (NAD(P)+)